MRSVLITGGSGFLGRALTRKLLSTADRICIYSRGEYMQSMAQDSIPDPDGKIRWMIGDIRDLQRLRWAMRDVDIVIHAAALKRIEVGAYAPSEMVQTNVVGTMNVIDAAAYCGVSKVVGISSDKAWQPISPYGQTKALAECLLLSGDTERHGPRYAVVRYGNVAGSTGSVIPRWREILRISDTVPVTDPEATRFWMTVEEAADLVLETAKDMTGGERMIPVELPAYRLGDLAKALNAKMNIIGLPEHEKKHESMSDGVSSDTARRMSIAELREALRRA